MKTSLLILVVMMVAVALLSHAKTLGNSQLDLSVSIKQRDAYLFNLWELYKNSSSSEFAEKIRDGITKIVYLDSRIDMLGLILFGARNHLLILHSVRDENLPLVDDEACLKSTMELFEKHCGVLDERMIQSLANICNHVAKKAAIEDAILVVCAMHAPESHSIVDVGNPKIDLTPAPIHGTSQYCGRVSVNGISRMKLQSYAKAYQVLLVPSVPERYDHLIQICFHQNDSLGLCKCEKDDWRSVQRGSWSSTMSPYEKKIIDVKFIVQLSADGYVTITLDEVSQGWRYILLVGGVSILFMAFSKDIIYKYIDDGALQFVKWAMLILAVACIFMSSVDTPLAMVAVCSCLVMCYVITSILSLILAKKTKFLPTGEVDALQEGRSTGSQKHYYSTNHKIRKRIRLSNKEYEQVPVQSVAEMASSPEFAQWVTKNAHRIKFRPKK